MPRHGKPSGAYLGASRHSSAAHHSMRRLDDSLADSHIRNHSMARIFDAHEQLFSSGTDVSPRPPPKFKFRGPRLIRSIGWL
jgi:hypothetical protein